jgi:drug/metabolite transporter (DMT)-like permease
MTNPNPTRPTPYHGLKPYLLVLLATFLWATNILLGRLLNTQIGPFSLAACRFTIAALLYAAMLRRGTLPSSPSPSPKRLSRREGWLLAAMALTGVVGFPGLLYLSLHWTTASKAAMINGTIPLATTLLAALFLREEIKSRHILGSLVSLTGVVLIIGGGSLALLKGNALNPGDLLVLLDCLLWGLYSVISRVVSRGRSALTVTAISTWLGMPLLYLIAAFEWHSHPPLLTGSLALWVVYIAIFPTCIGFFAWNEGVRLLGPTQSMAFYNLLPFFGVLLSVIFLGEQVTWVHLVGGLLILGGGLWVIWGKIKGG